jgi:hypothetical protein
MSPRLDEIHVPIGPPPRDVEGSSASIRLLFTWWGTEDVGEDLDFVQRGEGLGRCLRESRERSPTGRTRGIVVKELLFLSPSSAVVRFTVATDAGEFGPMEGRALRVETRWLIERATFCNLVARIGVQCPPLESQDK